MLVIRLTRTGKKGQPNYRIVVTDSRKSVYSPYVANIGHYDPKTKKVVLDGKLAEDWMNKGAKPSNTVAKIFEKEGLKHKSIVIKKFRAISKKELEAQKAADEAEKAKEQAEKEAAKEAFEAQVEAEKKEHEGEVDPLMAAANEAIAEVKEEEAEKAAEQAETPAEQASENAEDAAMPEQEEKSEDTGEDKA
jgi:small subunit ribosomal protein S16